MKFATLFIAAAVSLAAAISFGYPPVRDMPATRPAVHASTDPPRWPVGAQLVFDALAKKNRPGWYYPGMIPMDTHAGAAQPEFFVGGWSGPGRYLDEEKFRQVIRKTPASVIALDFEHWPTYWSTDDKEIEKGQQWTRLALQWIREERPDAIAFTYNSIRASWWTPVNARNARAIVAAGKEVPPGLGWWKTVLPDFEKAEASWRATSDRMSWGLDVRGRRDDRLGQLDAEDVISVQCYLCYEHGADVQGAISNDTHQIRGNIDEALRVADGRPVLVWMMPWLTHNTAKDTTIHPARWTAMLRTIASYKGQNVHLILWSWEDWTPTLQAKFDEALAVIGGKSEKTAFTPAPR